MMNFRKANKMISANKKSVVALGLCDVLAVVFIVLKLVGVIAWSWWWVLSPWLIPVALYLLCVLLICWIEAGNGH